MELDPEMEVQGAWRWMGFPEMSFPCDGKQEENDFHAMENSGRDAVAESWKGETFNCFSGWSVGFRIISKGGG